MGRYPPTFRVMRGHLVAMKREHTGKPLLGNWRDAFSHSPLPLPLPNCSYSCILSRLIQQLRLVSTTHCHTTKMPEDKSSNQSQPVATTDPLTCATELTKPSAPPNSTPTVRSSSLTHEMSDEEVMAFLHSHADRCEARWLPRETRKLGAKDIKTVLSGYGINSYKSRVSGNLLVSHI